MQVLEAVLYGDHFLFSEHKELRDAFVRVFFHSSSRKYNRVECWGPLKDAAKVQYTILNFYMIHFRANCILKELTFSIND